MIDQNYRDQNKIIRKASKKQKAKRNSIDSVMKNENTDLMISRKSNDEKKSETKNSLAAIDVENIFDEKMFHLKYIEDRVFI